MSTPFTLTLLIVVVALVFDYTNGFHDAANSIATVVSTRVLSPGKAVALAAFFNFAAFGLGTQVARTVGKGLVDLNQVNEWVILAGLVGAVSWNLITWYLGLPTSSSHALVGGYAGAAVAKSGLGVLIWKKWPEGWAGTLSAIVMSPLLGLLLGLLLMVAVFWIFRRTSPSRVDKYFRWGQLFSSSLFSLSHGSNDAQKTMGIILAALVIGGYHDPKNNDIPWWVVIGAYSAISLGTLSGGWRIVRTMGSKITKLKPVGGFCAETGGGLTILLMTYLGIPVSTTHTITGAIVGVGSTQRLSAVRWGVAGRIVWAWVITIPAAAGIAALIYYVISALRHVV
ncbi:MAG TPA: inorganic phosphate transporter [Blastocatellia bacterium]|nr:inorganic phosphate transporter [Blastocatellia bacterium]